MSKRSRARRPARGKPKPRKPRILCLCEGRYSEPEYLEGFRQARRNSRVDIEVIPAGGVPRTLVEKAKEKKREAARAAKRDTTLDYEQVWCVFDVDEHPKLDEARDMAAGNDIELAISNPCFELWLLLHFRENPGCQRRHTMRTMLREFVSGYDKHVKFAEFANGYQQAVDRARQLDDAAIEVGEAGRNPSAGVWRLTEVIAGTA